MHVYKPGAATVAHAATTSGLFRASAAEFAGATGAASAGATGAASVRMNHVHTHIVYVR